MEGGYYPMVQTIHHGAAANVAPPLNLGRAAFDGKRMRKQITRKAVDYAAPVMQYLQASVIIIINTSKKILIFPSLCRIATLRRIFGIYLRCRDMKHLLDRYAGNPSSNASNFVVSRCILLLQHLTSRHPVSLETLFTLQQTK